MSYHIKILIKKIIIFISGISFIKFFFLLVNTFSKENIKKINYINHDFYFINKNLITNYRIKTFSTKEPETLKWIDSFSTGSYFWDVGANIGLYSIYAAKMKDCNVLSFKPSFNNLEILSKNINLNNVSDKITIAPIALSDQTSVEYLYCTSSLEGSAHSSFNYEIDQKGKKMSTIFKYKTLGYKSDDFLYNFNMHYPKYIKIDVDGIEHLILKGAVLILQNVDELLLEVNSDYNEQYNEIKLILEKNEFKLTAHYFNEDILQGNQIWKKINE